MILGVLGGVLGALFTVINAWVMRIRNTYLYSNPRYTARTKILEIILISLLISTVYFWLPASPLTPCVTEQAHSATSASAADTIVYMNYTCAIESNAKRPGFGVSPFNVDPPPRQYNELASLLLTSQSNTVKNLFTRQTAHEFSATTLALFLGVFYLTAAVSAGSPTSCGLLFPILVIGSAMGRLYGVGLRQIFSEDQHIDPGVYSLIGAAAFFAGVTRMNISLCVIMLEITNDLQFLPPIMLTVVFAKWVSDRLSRPLYHILMDLKYIAFIEADPPHEMDKMVSFSLSLTLGISSCPRLNFCVWVCMDADCRGYYGQTGSVFAVGGGCFNDSQNDLFVYSQRISCG